MNRAIKKLEHILLDVSDSDHVFPDGVGSSHLKAKQPNCCPDVNRIEQGSGGLSLLLLFSSGIASQESIGDGEARP